jgi:hypothetical protein
MRSDNGGSGFRPRCRLALLSIATLAVLFPGVAAPTAAPAASVNPCGHGLATALLSPATNRTGLIDLYYFRPLGLPVTFFECVGDRPHRLGELASAPGSDRTILHAATSWACGRLTRHFAATTTAAGGQILLGTASARTVSCARRFALDVPREVTRGRLARVRVVDRWGIGGIRTRLCLTSPDAKRTCRVLAFAKAVGVVNRRFRVHTRGRWHVELQVRKYRVRDSIAVGVHSVVSHKMLPTVLATGDSTMQGVESFLSDELGAKATVVSDARPGLSISGSNDWAPIAASQAAALHPDVTVLSIGANEGLPMRAADGAVRECCDAAWSSEYERRMRTTMLTYARGLMGRVFVFTIPAPRDPGRARINSAVNAAIVRAARGLAGVHVLRMDLLFSPHGFREVIRYGGQDIDVREADGTHLNVSGTAIEARIVARALLDVQR